MIAPWAQDETAGANLGDTRLNQRLAEVLSSTGNHPTLSIPAACRGRAEMTAAYRFYDNDKVTLAKVLEPHIQQTRTRCAAQPVVLAVQDTSEVDVTRPEQQWLGSVNWTAPARASCFTNCKPSPRTAFRWAPCTPRSSTAPRASRTPRRR